MFNDLLRDLTAQLQSLEDEGKKYSPYEKAKQFASDCAPQSTSEAIAVGSAAGGGAVLGALAGKAVLPAVAVGVGVGLLASVGLGLYHQFQRNEKEETPAVDEVVVSA